MDQLITAFNYSWQSATWITWLVMFILGYTAINSYNKAYKENENFEAMKQNKNKSGLAHFYNSIIVSILSVIVFFLPYIFNYQGN